MASRPLHTPSPENLSPTRNQMHENAQKSTSCSSSRLGFRCLCSPAVTAPSADVGRRQFVVMRVYSSVWVLVAGENGKLSVIVKKFYEKWERASTLKGKKKYFCPGDCDEPVTIPDKFLNCDGVLSQISKLPSQIFLYSRASAIPSQIRFFRHNFRHKL